MPIDFRPFVFVLLNAWTLSCARRILDLNQNLDDLDDQTNLYTNTWVAHVDKGVDAARSLAEEHGFTFHGQLGSLRDLYLLEHRDVHKRSRRSAVDYHSKLQSHQDVLWVEQQKVLIRKKRGYFSDPLFEHQWYLKNTGQTQTICSSLLDINVFSAWNKNITGSGVVVSILDDGLEHTHIDLQRNYDPEGSHDFNGNDPDPMPRYSADNINKHGTRCAGEVAAEINNGVCGVGVAFNAKVGGIRMLDGDVTDAVEAGSLSLNPKHIDIYSSSWGPDDDGKTVDGPGPLAKRAFGNGILDGRGGLGSIFVWATGNGGRAKDYCSCDGYINSIYTVAIGAVDNCGRTPWYAEPCPGTLAVTYSSGDSGRDLQIATTDLYGRCTKDHTGTSAAAPLAAGIFALVLEANRRLTWRDLQHLIVQTSNVISADDPEWQKNGAGHMVNNKFGFGALDTDALITAATSQKWKTVPQQHICETKMVTDPVPIPSGGSATSTIVTDGCADMPFRVSKLEHVHCFVTIKHAQRGQLEITLRSPSGVVSPLLKRRARDTSTEGFSKWPFLTVFNWDEDPKGTWTLTVTDFTGRRNPGSLDGWHLKFYGTSDADVALNESINETEICDQECKRGCPVNFAKVCKGCSRFCDCTIGKCVHDCDDHLLADNQLRHCKRSLDFVNYEYIPNSGAQKVPSAKPLIGISLPAKLAITAVALVVVCLLVAGIAYLVGRMPGGGDLPIEYHSVSRHPCQEGECEDETESEADEIGSPALRT